jgi:hypothetical protein
MNAHRELDPIYCAFHINGGEHETDVVSLFQNLQRICATGRLGCPVAKSFARNGRFRAEDPVLFYNQDYVLLIRAV